MIFSFNNVLLLIGLIWLIVLTFFYYKLISHYNRLTHGTNSKSLTSILDSLLMQTHTLQKDIDVLKKRCDTIEKDNLLHIQKIGLLRFNPFKDTGGDQSFILSLLDAHNTGVVISGLYSRLGTRWYAKKVSEGKGIEHELSQEEQKALKMAIKHTVQ